MGVNGPAPDLLCEACCSCLEVADWDCCSSGLRTPQDSALRTTPIATSNQLNHFLLNMLSNSVFHCFSFVSLCLFNCSRSHRNQTSVFKTIMFVLKRDPQIKELLGTDIQLGFGDYIGGPVNEQKGFVGCSGTFGFCEEMED